MCSIGVLETPGLSLRVHDTFSTCMASFIVHCLATSTRGGRNIQVLVSRLKDTTSILHISGTG